MSAREIIADTHFTVPIGNASVSGRIGEAWADRVLARLQDAGYRLIPPGSLDRETIEKCAALIEDHDILDGSGGQELRPRKEGNRSGLVYAAAIRALGAEK